MNDDLLIRGGCHCGALRYELYWPSPEPAASRVPVTARRCSCSFCTSIDGAWTSHPDAQLKIFEDRDHPPTSYRFGTQTADFMFCSRCGIMPLVRCEIDGRLLAVVNVNTFDESSMQQIELGYSDACFDDETTGDRLSRRRARWIGKVRLAEN